MPIHYNHEPEDDPVDVWIKHANGEGVKKRTVDSLMTTKYGFVKLCAGADQTYYPRERIAKFVPR